MNNKYTLKELVKVYEKTYYQNGSEAGIKAVLDFIGYEFPKDEEREAFDKWSKEVAFLEGATLFEAWKAGREELRKEIGSEKCRNTKIEPAWIPWTGGSKSPINGLQTRCEIQCRDGTRHISDHNIFRWAHSNTPGDILAYRIIEP